MAIILRLAILISIEIILLTLIQGESLEEATSLHATLKSGYNKFIRPVKDQKTALNVNISMAAVALQEFDEVLQTFSVVSVFILSWKDDNMIWDSNQTGTESLLMSYKDVWVPEIILTNPSSKLDSFGKEWQLLRYSANGYANWYPGDLVKATCTLNVRYFPFDIQECSMELYAWGYTVSEVKLNSVSDVIDTAIMAKHGSWEVIGTRAKAEEIKYVSRATFTFRLKRKQQYIIINVVLPILFFCVLNTLVFLMPAESGERISYSITVMLSIAVFMTIVSDTLPKTSEPISLYSYFLMMDLIMSALITVVSVLNLRLFHKKAIDPVSPWLIWLYGACTHLSCKLCLQTKTNPRDEEVEISKQNIQVSLVRAYSGEPDQRKRNGGSTKGSNFGVKRPISASLDDLERRITWQDISSFVDNISFILSISLIVIKFVIFITITQYNAI